MKYNIIGDIHGRTCWKDLVIEDGINVFVGDYFSPYHREISWEQQRDNFIDIIEYKQLHFDTTILLVGNHDEDHWHDFDGGCSRHNYTHGHDIQQLFEVYKDYFTVAYSIENKVLVTHAGVTSVWYNYHFLNGKFAEDMSLEERKKLTPDIVAQNINELWKENPVRPFSFRHNCCDFSDYYGSSKTHGPMWARYNEAMWLWSLFRETEYIQVYGHTLSDNIIHYQDTIYEIEENEGKRVSIPYCPGTGHKYMVDCLESCIESLIVEIVDNKVNIYKNTVENKQTD